MAWSLHRTGRYSRVWADGTARSLVASMRPIHYESVTGSGVYDAPINLAPQRVQNALLDGWIVNANGWRYALGQPAGESDGWTGFGGRGGQNWFRFRLVRAGYLHGPTRAWQDIGGAPSYVRAQLSLTPLSRPLGPLGETVTTAAQVTWANLWATPGGGAVSVRWRLSGAALKEEIIVNRAAREWIAANRPPATPASETYFGFVFRLDWTDVPAIVHAGITQDRNGDFADTGVPIELRDAAGRLLALLPLDYVTVPGYRPGLDAAQYRRPLRKRFWLDGDGNHYLAVGLLVSELAQMAPGDLIFDPTIADTTTGTDDCESDGTTFLDTGYTNVLYASTSDANDTGEHVGLRFDLSALVQGDTITAATITVNLSEVNTTPTVRIDAEDAADPATFGATHRPGQLTSFPATTATVSWSPTVTGSNTTPSLVSIVQELATDYNVGNVCFRLHRTAGGWIGVDDNAAASADPSISVTYTTAGGVFIKMVGNNFRLAGEGGLAA